MMHYQPWIQQQQLIMDHPYYQHSSSDLQPYYSSSEHQVDDNDYVGDEIPSETSGDQSPNTDMFRLEFAASQWSKLVLNAEGLFNKLMSLNVLSQNEQNLLKNQIEQWLCMKQEYEECIAGDDSGSLHGYIENTRRSLERIEEVTETEEKTDESNIWTKLQSRTKSCSGSESEIFDDEDQSDIESENSDFLDKLDEYMKKFKIQTDEIIDLKENDISKDISQLMKVDNSSFASPIKTIPNQNRSSRRMSILPYSEMSNDITKFQKQNNINAYISSCSNSLGCSNGTEINEPEAVNTNIFEEETENLTIKCQNIDVDPEDINLLKVLVNSNEEKQLQLKKLQLDLDLSYKQFDKLESTINVKEQFMKDLLQNCDIRNSVNQKFQRKRCKFEEKYRNVEKVLNYKRLHRNSEDEGSYKEEIEKYENLLMYYEKKIKDTKIIKQVVGASTKTLIYLKDSLNESKNQLEVLKQKLKDEENIKRLTEDELLHNQQKIKEFEKMYNVNGFKLREIVSENLDKKNSFKLKPIADDKDPSFIEVNERISKLDHLLKEKLEVDKAENADEKEHLRQEIRNLRHIRDQLIDMKCTYTSDRMSNTIEEKQRQILLISEYIETIDVMIEQKNVMICDERNLKGKKVSNVDEQMLIMNRLEKLTHDELITLFYKYFYKVIDLKDSSKNLEIQNATLEQSLKKQEMENDVKMIKLQKSYERQISLLFNYYADETSSSSYDNKFDRNKDFEKLVKENQVLRRRLTHFDSLLKASGTAQTVQSNSVKSVKPELKSELMQIALPPKTTKVTRQGNKLIILTSRKEK